MVFEPKHDVLRILGRFNGKELTLLSRNNHPRNIQFPDVVRTLRASLERPT
jgi:hypothetical protein